MVATLVLVSECMELRFVVSRHMVLHPGILANISLTWKQNKHYDMHMKQVFLQINQINYDILRVGYPGI